MSEPKGRHDIYAKLQHLKELAQPLGEKDDWWFPIHVSGAVAEYPHWEVWRVGDNSTVVSVAGWEAHDQEQVAGYIAAAEPRTVATLIAFYDSTSDRLSETQAEVARLSAELREVRAKTLDEAAQICQERADFYSTHPEAASKDPVEYQRAYSMGAFKCAQLIREALIDTPEEGKES